MQYRFGHQEVHGGDDGKTYGEPVGEEERAGPATLLLTPDPRERDGREQRDDDFLPALDGSNEDVRSAKAQHHHQHEAVEGHAGHEESEADEWMAPGPPEPQG